MKKLVMLIALLLCACGPNYSDGSRIGVVTKLSHKGIIFKSWEGEMLVGGMKQKDTAHYNSKGEYAGSSTSMVPNVFEFNVDESQVEKVKKAMMDGKTVELVYRQWFIRPKTIEHDHVIIEVKELD